MDGTKIIKEMNLQRILKENDINDIVNQLDAEATKANSHAPDLVMTLFPH